MKHILAQLLIDSESVFMCLFYCMLSFLISLVKTSKKLDLKCQNNRKLIASVYISQKIWHSSQIFYF